MNNEKRPPCRMLVLIATPKLTDKAAAMFKEQNIPIQYRLSAQGTASSDIMDTFGFGSIDKSILISTVTKPLGNIMLGQLHSKLRLDAVNSGIAFTIPLTGVTALMLKMMDSAQQSNVPSENGKDETTMSENKYTLIAAVVDRGYGGDVMDAAKAAGAGGGTIIHSRGIQSEGAAGFWGLGLQEEKQIVLILAEHESKLAIMNAIGEKCGMNTEAKGVVMSLPIDSVMGL